MIVGTAGSIKLEVAPGNLVIVDSAVRDDGISSHYLPPDTFVDAHPRLLNQVVAAAESLHHACLVAPTWTVPTPYRSTAAEVEQLSAEGVAVVECEVASLLAVAEALGVEAGAILSVTSTLVGNEATPSLRPAGLAELLEVALVSLKTSD